MGAEDQEHKLSMLWLTLERAYQDGKFDYSDNDLETAKQDSTRDGYWAQQFNSYLQRLDLFPVGSPQWMQAAAKFTATALGFFESAIRVYGRPPEPGHPSGELREWT